MKTWVPLRVLDISFLTPVPALLADSRGRLEEVPESHLNEPASVEELIQRLEDVEGTKIGFPGPLEYSFDPVYAALKDRGKVAVDSLLDAYEFDKRLTRTFDWGRPWSIEQTPTPVHDVVELLLIAVLGEPARGANPAAMRALWRQANPL